MKNKKIGLIGLGKMGYRMAERLIEQGYAVVGFDINQKVVEDLEKKGGVGVSSVKELANNLAGPRVILLSIPAGQAIDKTIKDLAPYLSEGDIIIDSGNSFYMDSQSRAAYLKENGIYFIDAGISGGIRGARNGACLMIGGEREAFEKARDVFEALSKQGSYKYLGKSGSGHLVKGYHNLVLYGYLQALAEGLVCINKISEDDDLGIKIQDVCGIWNRGSIVESRITRDAESALKKNPNLDGISGSVFGQSQKEMEKLVKTAKDSGVVVPSCESALNARIASQKRPTLAGRIINAVRNVFGGHEEWKD